jgi:hypothetical protein
VLPIVIPRFFEYHIGLLKVIMKQKLIGQNTIESKSLRSCLNLFCSFPESLPLTSLAHFVQAPVGLLTWKLLDILRHALVGDAVGHRNAFLDVLFKMLSCLVSYVPSFRPPPIFFLVSNTFCHQWERIPTLTSIGCDDLSADWAYHLNFGR